MINSSLTDIKENDMLKYDRLLLPILLKDHSSKKNIIWATDNYEPLGEGYKFSSHIEVSAITGSNGTIIRPRVNKNKAEQQSRVKDKAEVFTPSWICNKQNNLIDNAWFATDEDIFNIEIDKIWQPIERPISFPTKEGKTWQDYVRDIRLEVSCGEAPYLASRYDTITGEFIEIKCRIGLLDRKLRVISENIDNKEEWFEWTRIAFQSVYGFEWQGDNLLLARENLLYTLLDYHKAKFGEIPNKEHIREIAKIISWNIWQMDGLKGVIPNSCSDHMIITYNLFGEADEAVIKCGGCQKNDIKKHNGIYCKIKDWQTGRTLKFVSLLK